MTDMFDKLIDLWKKEKVSNRVPLFYPNLKTNSMLFIGLNPSFSKKGFKKILKGTEYENALDNIEDFYCFEDFNKEKIKDFQKIEKYSRQNHPYFSKFRNISQEIGIDWEHIDLFFIRDTSQKHIEKLFKTNKEFINEQIKMTIELLKTLNPKLMIIENAFAAKILQEKLSLQWNDDIGTFEDSNKVPVFITGMLSGGRALDLGSFKRLKWQIKLVCNKRKIN